MKTPSTPAILSENFVRSLKDTFPESGGKFARSTSQYSRAGLKFLQKASEFTSAVKDVHQKNKADQTQTDSASKVNTSNYSSKKMEELKNLHDRIENPAVYGGEIIRKIRLEKRKMRRDDLRRKHVIDCVRCPNPSDIPVFPRRYGKATGKRPRLFAGPLPDFILD